MGKKSIVSVLLLCTLLSAFGNENSDYITSKDRATAKDAHKSVKKFCKPGRERLDEEDTAAGRESLESALGGPDENFLLDAAKESKNGDEFGENLGESFLQKMQHQVVPIFFVVVSLNLLACFLCTALPCFKNLPCCRPCKVESDNPLWIKSILVLFVLIAFLVVMICVLGARKGGSRLVDGIDNMACESAMVLNSTLQGSDEFVGLMPALETLEDITGILDTGSSFMEDLNARLDDTKAISDAIIMATSVFDAMSLVLKNTSDLLASAPAVTGELHRSCLICGPLEQGLSQVSAKLADGVGQALANARNEVDAQFTPARRVEIKKLIVSASRPMVEMKDSFVSNIGIFVDPENNSLEPLKQVPNAVIAIFLGSFLVVLCGCCSSGSLCVREKATNGSYSKVPHRCGCCTWCFGLIVAILCFVLGGILLGVSVPLSAVCLIMDDVDGEMLKDIGPALEMDVTSADGQNLLNLIDKCINPEDRSINPNLLDLIKVTEDDGGNATMKEKLVDQLAKPIEDKFSAITSKMTGNQNLSSATPVTELLNRIYQNPIEARILVNSSTMGQATKFAPLASTVNDALKKGLVSSLNCSDSNFEGNVVPGLNSFMQAYTSQCMPSATSSTLSTMCGDINVDPGHSNGSVCAAAYEYLKQISEIDQSLMFSCVVWEDANGDDCDLNDLNVNIGKTCISADGTMKFKEKKCNFQDFKADYAKFHGRIQKTIQNIDVAVAAKATAITEGLFDLVKQYMLEPFLGIFEGVTCGWMPEFWQAMVDSFCYQGVYGVRTVGHAYVLSAVFCVILAVSMYVLWRRTIDNVNRNQLLALP